MAEERRPRESSVKRDASAGGAAENPATILEELAEYCRTAGEYSSAIEYYHQILGIADRASRSAGMVASTCRKLAACLLDAGNPAAALRVLARKDAEEGDARDPWGRAASLALRARAYHATGQVDDAEAHAHDALGLLSAEEPHAIALAAHHVLGEIALARGDTRSAGAHFEAALVFASEAQDAAGVRRARFAAARVARREGRLHEAGIAAASLADDTSDPARAADALDLLSEIRLLEGRFGDTITCARRVDELAPAAAGAWGSRVAAIFAARAIDPDREEASADAAASIREAAKAGGDEGVRRLRDHLFLEAVREAARSGGDRLRPAAIESSDPVIAALSDGLAALARGDENHAAAARDELDAALSRLRQQGAADPLASLLLLGAARFGGRDPEWSDEAFAEAAGLFRAAARPRDVVHALVARARHALARDAHTEALRALERAAATAREEGIDEEAAEIRSLRGAVDSALARFGNRQLGSLAEFNDLIRGLRLLEDPAASLRRLVEVAIRWSGADAALLLLEAPDSSWSVFHCEGIADSERARILDIGRWVARAVVAEGGQSFASTNPAADARLATGAPPHEGIGSLLAAPLLAEGRVVGVLVAVRAAGGAQFPSESLPFLVALATVASSIAADQRGEEMRRENLLLRHRLGFEGGFEGFVTQNPRMMEVIETLKRAAAGSTTVLLQGETGTGKELLARALHQHGIAQRAGSFVTVSCSELTHELLESELFGHTRGAFTGAAEEKRGLFQIADGGTVFLDQIDKTSRDFQEALLRVVDRREIKPVGATQSQMIDVRIVCASNVELRRAVDEGRFLKDLYYRLRVIAVTIPPLRERSEDVPLLAEHFLRALSRRFGKSIRGFAPDAMARLVACPWPGNVRDLENEVERLVALAPNGDDIRPEMLSAEVGGGGFAGGLRVEPGRSLAEVVEEIERGLLLEALVTCQGNRSRAARRLGLSRRGLLNKIERYGLEDVGRSTREPPSA
ncbi:MAG: sigma 54-interacting transcriptional regulator [bacterium]